MKRVLFVDDEPHVLESLRDALRPRRHEWRMAFAEGAEPALEELGRHEYDVVVSDMRMPGTDGAALLARVQELQPSTVRLVLSGYADANVIARAGAVAHRFLAKPCDTAELARVVERSCAIKELAERDPLRRAAARATRLPCAPAIYHQLSALLAGADASVEEVADLVERDIAISARVLQLANSAFFGRAQPVTRIGDAVLYLGLSTVEALVLSAGALEAFEPIPAIPGFSLEHVQRHGALVARIARQVLGGKAQADDAVTAGMVHDVGLLVLAVQEPAYLAEVLASAARERRPVVDIEYERRGVSHAEVGAHLLTLWGLPHAIVEAVAYHHRPQAAHGAVLDHVAAVYIADALVNDCEAGRAPGPGGCAKPLDMDYVQRLGVADRIPEWRELTARELDRD
jgi:HD-like signal output (HDOD) protein